MFGQNLQNTAKAIWGVTDVSRLTLKWTFKTSGDVSARVVVGKVAYFPGHHITPWCMVAGSTPGWRCCRRRRLRTRPSRAARRVAVWWRSA